MYNSVRKAMKEMIHFLGVKKFSFILIFIVCISAFGIIEPIFMAKTISFIEDFLKTGQFDMVGFLVFLGIWAAFILLATFFEYIRRYYLSDKIALEFHNFLAKKYVDSVYFMNMGEYLSKKSGGLFKDFDRGTGAGFSAVFFVLWNAIKTIFALIVALGIMLYFDFRMTLLAISMLPFMALTAYFINKKTHIPQKENEEKWTEAFGFIGDFLSNMQLGKILRLEEKFRKKFDNEVDEALRLQKFTSKWWSASDMITGVFAMISRFLVIGGGVYFIMKWELTLSGLILVFSYIEKIYYPISWVFGSLPNLQRWDMQLSKFYEEFDKTDYERLSDGKNYKKWNGKIEFQNVDFGYNEERKIFEKLSFVVKPGQKVALVGNTGAGKSTILSLLFRFYEPNSGKILLDDQDILKLKKSELRSHIGMVSQDNSLFNLSIRENLLFAKPNATEDDLKKALHNASADFVYNLENGIDTKIWERGLKLSGGEKQRLSIARIFLQNPEILIFDEATSALDNKTEKAIQDSLATLMEGKTTIIIAHRLSTIRDVDVIFMIENGKIIESGSYNELVKKGGKFAELADPSRLVIS